MVTFEQITTYLNYQNGCTLEKYFIWLDIFRPACNAVPMDNKDDDDEKTKDNNLQFLRQSREKTQAPA